MPITAKYNKKTPMNVLFYSNYFLKPQQNTDYKTHSITYLPNIHVETKSFQGSFQQDLPWQLVAGIKDNVALSAGAHVLICHTQLVVARLGGVFVVCLDFIFLQGIHDLLANAGVKMRCNTIS